MSKETFKTFKGLSLESADALKNIATIIDGGHMLAICSDPEYSEVGDMIINFASQYAAAACAYALEEKK